MPYMLTLLVDTHYAEASLMPLLVNKIIFKIIPERSPFLIRPLLRSVFNQVSALMLNPRLKAHVQMVSTLPCLAPYHTRMVPC